MIDPGTTAGITNDLTRILKPLARMTSRSNTSWPRSSVTRPSGAIVRPSMSRTRRRGVYISSTLPCASRPRSENTLIRTWCWRMVASSSRSSESVKRTSHSSASASACGSSRGALSAVSAAGITGQSAARAAPAGAIAKSAPTREIHPIQRTRRDREYMAGGMQAPNPAADGVRQATLFVVNDGRGVILRARRVLGRDVVVDRARGSRCASSS